MTTTPSKMDEPKECIVYLAANVVLPTRGRMYVGMTEKTLEQRKYRHAYAAKTGSKLHFHCALRKYGSDGFEWRILDRQPTYRLALESERWHIAALKKTYNLYNKTDGGGGIKGFRMSAKSREKMSRAKKGKPNHWSGGRMPQGMRDRLALLRKTEKRILTEEIRSSLRINAAKANVARRRAVICINDQKRYESLTAASIYYGLTTGQITRLCKLGCSTRKGLRFRYADEVDA